MNTIKILAAIEKKRENYSLKDNTNKVSVINATIRIGELYLASR